MVWVNVFDFEGCGNRPRTIPVNPTVQEAGLYPNATNQILHDIIFKFVDVGTGIL